MDSSILISTKKILGLAEDYTVFDLDIITYINSALVSLNQLGVGPVGAALVIEDASATWSQLGLSVNELGPAKVYVCLKTRMLFDPPATSFGMDAINSIIRENEWKLNVHRETAKDPFYTVPGVIV